MASRQSMSSSRERSGASLRRKLAEDDVGIELSDLRARAADLEAASQPLQVDRCRFIYNLDNAVEVEQMAHDIWREPYEGSLRELRECNSELVNVLKGCTRNQSKQTASAMENKAHLLDGVLLNLCRTQSQKRM